MYNDIPQEQITPNNRGESHGVEYAGILKELSPDKKVIHLVKELQGKVWDGSKNKYVTIEGSKPIMNEKGINAFIHQATTVLNPIVTMSNYRKETDLIYRLVMMQVREASKHFHLNWQRYEMSGKHMAKVVVDKLMILGLSAYFKALGAGDRKAGTQNISESFQTLQKGEPERKRSFADRLGFNFGGNRR